MAPQEQDRLNELWRATRNAEREQREEERRREQGEGVDRRKMKWELHKNIPQQRLIIKEISLQTLEGDSEGAWR